MSGAQENWRPAPGWEGAYEVSDSFDEVNHLNGVKSDPRAINLEWTDSEGNHQHAWRTGLRTRKHLPIKTGASNGAARLTPAAVEQARAEYATGEISMAALARKLGIAKRTVFDVLRGRRWSHVATAHVEEIGAVARVRVALGRRRGGINRASTLSAERRQEISEMGSRARWPKSSANAGEIARR